MAMAPKKNCFIIMPITTPKHLLVKYNNDKEHFLHVLNHLFIPVLENLGYSPIPPKIKGAQIIQSEIIKKIEDADLVLCDMTSLNPNVFFELGIRTALNKPVCLVKDDVTEVIPFDTSIINTYTYKSNLNVWELQEELKKLQTHIEESIKSGSNTNALWSTFGISMATNTRILSGEEGKLDLIYAKLNFLTDNISRFAPSTSGGALFKLSKHAEETILDALSTIIYSILSEHGIEAESIEFDEELDNQIDVFLNENLPVGVEEKINKNIKKYNFKAEFFYHQKLD
jgi:nucleoside 2-deoxyribosyltransferase